MNPAIAEVKSKKLARLVSIKANDAGELPTQIELLQTGMWDAPYHGMFMIGMTNLQGYVDNFNNDVRASSSSQGLPIDYEHDADGGAAGWITALTIAAPSDAMLAANGVMSLWASVTWTAPGAQALLDGVYKFISPEFCPNEYIDPEGIAEPCDNVLIGAGLTNRPLFKNLQPLMASDDAHAKAGGGDEDKLYIKLNKEKSVELNQIRTKNASDLSDDEKKFLADHKAELSADEKAKFGLSADDTNADKGDATDKVDKPADTTTTEPVAASDKTGMVTISANELAELQAKADRGNVAAEKLEAKEASDRLESFAFAASDGVKFKPGQRDEVTKFYLSCSSEQRTAFEKIVKDMQPIAAADAFKKTGSDAETEQSAKTVATLKANELMEEATKAGKTLKFSDALRQVFAANDGLSKQYQEELQATA